MLKGGESPEPGHGEGAAFPARQVVHGEAAGDRGTRIADRCRRPGERAGLRPRPHEPATDGRLHLLRRGETAVAVDKAAAAASLLQRRDAVGIEAGFFSMMSTTRGQRRLARSIAFNRRRRGSVATSENDLTCG